MTSPIGSLATGIVAALAAATVLTGGLAAGAAAGPPSNPATSSGHGEIATEQAATTPSPSPSARPAQVFEERRCGQYLYRAVTADYDFSGELDPGDALPTVTVTGPTGAVVFSWAGHMSNDRGLFLWCRDVTGDGVADLGYELLGSGAHCCATVVALRLGADPAEILRVGVGDGQGLTPMQLDRSAALELVTPDYRLAEMAGSFMSTSPFPRVFALHGGVYVDDPGAGRSLLLADRARAAAEIASYSPSRSGPDEAALGVGLRIEAIDLLLGTPTSGISRLPVDLATRRAILSMRRPVAKAIGAASGALHPQTIDLGFWSETYVGESGLVLAQATSGLPVTVTSLTPEVCALSAGTGSWAVIVSFRQIGTCMLRSTQPGDSYWRALRYTTSIDVTEWESAE
jgi:hypothetical protein